MVRRRARCVVAVPRVLSDRAVRGLRVRAHADPRTRPSVQLAVHAVLCRGAAARAARAAGRGVEARARRDPSAAILAMLLANVALPFAALAATGPLVAAWFARRFPERSPYPLYAVSNAGSLLALLVYPFALEPRLALSATGRLWSAAFIATGVAVLACAELARRSAREPRRRPRRSRRSSRRARVALGTAPGVRGRGADGDDERALSRHRERAVPVDPAARDLSRDADPVLRCRAHRTAGAVSARSRRSRCSGPLIALARRPGADVDVVRAMRSCSERSLRADAVRASA